MLQRSSEHPYLPPEEPIANAVEGGAHQSVDLREMGRILRRRWRTVASVPVALLGVALVYILLATTLYTATATVFVDPRRASIRLCCRVSEPMTPPSKARRC